MALLGVVAVDIDRHDQKNPTICSLRSRYRQFQAKPSQFFVAVFDSLVAVTTRSGAYFCGGFRGDDDRDFPLRIRAGTRFVTELAAWTLTSFLCHIIFSEWTCTCGKIR